MVLRGGEVPVALPLQNSNWQRGSQHQRSGGCEAGTHLTFPFSVSYGSQKKKDQRGMGVGRASTGGGEPGGGEVPLDYSL